MCYACCWAEWQRESAYHLSEVTSGKMFRSSVPKTIGTSRWIITNCEGTSTVIHPEKVTVQKKKKKYRDRLKYYLTNRDSKKSGKGQQSLLSFCI